MKETKSRYKIKLLCLVLILVMAVGFAVSVNDNELEGIFTNAKSEGHPSFMSFEFTGDIFVSVINIPITPSMEISEYAFERMQPSEYGGYFIQLVQRGRFSINNEVYAKGITFVFSGGGVRHHPFSRTRNTLTIGESQFIAL